MAWQDVARARAGGLAPAVINALSSVDPNYDWSAAINQSADASDAAWGAGAWQDPGRGSPSAFASGVIGAVNRMDPTSSGMDAALPRLDAAGKNEAAAIQAEQATHGGKGLGDLGTILGIAGLAFGGAGALGLLGDFGAGAGALSGAADLGMSFPGLEGMGTLGIGADLGGAAAGAAAGGGAMDLGGGLTLDQFGNVTGGLFQGGGSMSDLTGGALTNAGSAASMPGGVQQLIQQLQQMPGGSQLASALVQQLIGGGGSAAGGSPSGTGLNLGSLLPLLGIGSGLKTMFGTNPAVDPNMVKALWQAGQNTYNTSLDPQAALYGRTAQQVQDQARQANAATGVGMGPYAAGVEDQAMRNFNIDWQNAQLGRQVQGTDAFARAGGVGAQAGVAGAAQQFAQNQTGLNNLTTGAGQLFGAPGAGGGGTGSANPFGNWLNSAFTSLFPGTGGGGTTGGFDPNSSYNSAGTFQPYYTGTDISGGPAYG